MNPFEQLLAVQTHDTHLDQLRHRRDTLPERAELEARSEELATLDASVAHAEERKAELVAQQRRLEDEVALLEARSSELDEVLYRSGTITSPKEAQALSDELDSLAKRRRRLEDDVLELMEQIEPIDAELAELATRRDELGARIDATRAELAAREAEVDAEIREVEAHRAEATADVDPSHLSEYEQLRKQLGGIAVARLHAGACGGCNLTLSAVERDRLKSLPPDEPAYCEECGRLLVR